MRYFLFTFLILLLVTGLTVAQDETPEPLLPHQTVVPMELDELIEWMESVQSVLDEQIAGNWYLTAVFNNATNTRVTWFETCCLGAVSIEETRFCCTSNIATFFGYEQAMLPYYQVTLANYAPFEVVESCEVDGIRIHLFKGVSNGYDFYLLNYHVLDGLIARNTGLSFRSLEELERYSQVLFPDVSCSDDTEATEESQ
jgi:hypothetical protein